MKKIVALLLLVSAMLAFTACATTPCTEHKDADGDSICDVCKETIKEEKPQDGGAALSVADFASAMKDMKGNRVVIKIKETSDFGTLSSTYTVVFGSENSAVISYQSEAWDTSANIFELQTPAKIQKTGEVTYRNGQYSGGELNGAAQSVAKLALNLSKDKLASPVIVGTAADGATLTAVVPAAYSADVLGTAFAADVALSVTMNKGAQSISAFTLSYAAGGNAITFAASYE